MRVSTTPKVIPSFLLPNERPGTRKEVEGEFDWHRLIPASVHPAKVAIIEAMAWVRQPLSAKELWKVLGVNNWSEGVIAHHVRALAELSLIEATDHRSVRGARETYYVLRLDAGELDRGEGE